MWYSSLKPSGWHVLTRDHTVLPATHTFKQKWNEPSCLYSPVASHPATHGCSCMEQSSHQCHYSNFSGLLQKTTKNISYHKVIPGILVCVPCPRSTFAHATLICTFLTNFGWYSFSVSLRVGGWVGLGGSVKYWDGLLTQRRYTIPVLAAATWNQTCDLHQVASPAA